MLKSLVSAITLMAMIVMFFPTTASASGGGCPEVDGFAIDVNMWYYYGECDYSPLIPDGLFCKTDADCGVGGGVGVVDEALVSFTNTCHVLSVEGAPVVGICMPSVVEVEWCAYGADETTGVCNEQMLCSSNIDCVDTGVCSAGNCVVADVYTHCDSDYDCRYSTWGPFCVKDTSTGQKFCQECVPPTTLPLFSLRGRVDTGCYKDNSRPICSSRNMSWQQGRPSFLCVK